ncbi:MAG: ATP-binding protein [Cyanobacteriota bacterium]|nr:ATP-binding protein [Cyanobacteriota bacterium]
MNTSHNFTTNPYIFGKPLYKKEQLYGREETIRQIENNFKTNIKITLLHVQRRIGKTSLITCLPQFFTEEQNGFKFVTFSFQGYKDQSIPGILNYLADEIAANIDGLPKKVREQADGSHNFFQLFLPKIINEYLSGKKLVLLLDEFDVLGEDPTISTPGKYLFDELEKVVKQEEKLFAILVFGRPLKDMTYLKEFLDKEDRKPIEVSLLSEESTRNLIVNPAKGKLEYESDAINAIWQLSAGHPSLTQLLCLNIFKHCREKKIEKVTHADVSSSIVNQAMMEGEAVLQGFLDALNNLEKLFFRAVAATQNEVGENRLKTYIKNWQSVGKRLVEEYSFLEEKEDGTGYKIKVELVRLWLVKKYPLSDEERLQMGKIPEKNQNLPETNNNHNMTLPEQNDNPQRPNPIAEFLSLFVVFFTILALGIFSFSVIRNSSNSRASRSECSKLLGEINKALEDSKERSRVIEKVRNEWLRKEESLDLQCPYNYELDRKYNELLYRYGWNQINIGEYDRAIKPLCEITKEYEKFREVEDILSEWVLSDQKLSMENKEKVIEALIEQEQSGNDCLAYSFTSERNKNRLFEQQQKLSEQKNESFYQQAQEHINSLKFENAVEAYCQISEDYEKFPGIQTQLQSWLSDDPNLFDDERKKVREKLTQLKNNCLVSPLNN